MTQARIYRTNSKDGTPSPEPFLDQSQARSISVRNPRMYKGDRNFASNDSTSSTIALEKTTGEPYMKTNNAGINREPIEDKQSSPWEHSVFTQMLTVMQRLIIHRLRTPLITFLIVAMPPIFAALVIIMQYSVGAGSMKAETFFNYGDAENERLLNTPATLLRAACYNSIDAIYGLPPCNAMNVSSVTCLDTAPYASLLPVTGLCFAGMTRASLVGTVVWWATSLKKHIMPVPTLDEMILLRWISIAYSLSGVQQLMSLRRGHTLFFSPNTAAIRELQSSLMTSSRFFAYANGGIYNTLEDAQDKVQRLSEDKVWAVITIDSINTSLLKYEVQLSRTSMPRLSRKYVLLYGGGYPDTNADLHVTAGLCTIQRAMSEYYATEVLKIDRPPTPTLTPMGYPAVKKSGEFLNIAGDAMPILIVFSFLLTVTQLTRALVQDKESRIRQAMHVMGLRTFAYYGAWWVINGALMFISCAIIIVLFKATNVLTKADISLVFLIFFLYSLAVLSIIVLFSAILKSARVAFTMSGVLFLVFAMPLVCVYYSPQNVVYASLLSPVASFGQALQHVFHREVLDGVQWSNIFDINYDYSQNVQVSIFFSIISLFADILIYFLIGLWIEQIVGGETGAKKPWYFCFTLPFVWLSRIGKRPKLPECLLEPEYMYDNCDPNGIYEEEPPVEEIGECTLIRGICKSFNKRKAVDGISLTLYPQTISVLLGGNGAGKSTLLNTAMGLMEPDSGDNFVFGHSMRYEKTNARRFIGFCPQSNILWPDLTCAEHLKFYAQLKGSFGERREQEVEETLRAVNLYDERNVLAGRLSGGQKRKLSIAIAYVGRSNRLVFLDEPTAGVDVGSRHMIWDYIKKMSPGRCVLLTTHFMDEADALGDVVSIISQGRLRCCGTPAFLKSALGVGYTLNLSVNDPSCISSIVDAVVDFVPKAERTSAAHSTEVVIRLPMDSTDQFSYLFSYLEQIKQEEHGLDAISLTYTTLDDVFIRVVSDAPGNLHSDYDTNSPLECTDPYSEKGYAVGTPLRMRSQYDDETGRAGSPSSRWYRSVTIAHRLPPPSINKNEDDLITGRLANLWKNETYKADGASAVEQFGALMYKRFWSSIRDTRAIFFQCVIPFVCVLFVMILHLVIKQIFPVVPLSPSVYGEVTEVTLAGNCADYFYISNTGAFADLTRASYIANISDAAQFSEKLVEEFNAHQYPRFTGIFCNDERMPQMYSSAPAPFVSLLANITMYQEYGVTLGTFYSQYLYRQSNGSAVVNAATQALPATARETALTDSFWAMWYAAFILIPYGLISTVYTSWVATERELKVRHLQALRGLRTNVYWISNFVFDLCFYFFGTFLVLAIIFAFQETSFVGTRIKACATILIFFVYGFTCVATCYAFSFLFNSDYSARSFILLFNFFTGFALVVIINLLSMFPNTKSGADKFRWPLRIFPAYAFGEAVINIANLEVVSIINGVNVSPFGFEPYECGIDLIFITVGFPLLFLFTTIVDGPVRRLLQLRRARKAASASASHDQKIEEEPDVAEERAYAESAEAEQDPVVLRNLRIGYSGGKVAVHDLSFSMRASEIFCFLGTNGAGKTSTMSVATLYRPPTSGFGYVADQNLLSRPEEAMGQIGFCPQNDALFPLLTVQEHLAFYMSLSGTRKNKVVEISDILLTLLSLDPYRNIVAKNLSGGNKRKLSVAISLVGGPTVLFLDEPSSGMDPVSRYKLWRAVRSIPQYCSVMLTTHHLEEVEALAHRVAIMDRGKLRCIGNKTQLKNRFNNGFEMIVSLYENADSEKVVAFFAAELPKAVLRIAHTTRCEYELPGDTLLSSVFRLLKEKKEDLDIEHYSISQSSIELVFLRISQASAVEEEEAHKAQLH